MKIWPDNDDSTVDNEELDMETLCFCHVTNDNEHGDDDDDDDDDNGVIVDRVEQESEAARAKLERVISAVARG